MNKETIPRPNASPAVPPAETTATSEEAGLSPAGTAFWLVSALGFGVLAHVLQWNAWGLEYGWHVAVRRLAAVLFWLPALIFARVRPTRGTLGLWLLFSVFSLAFALYDSPLVLVWAWLAAVVVEFFALEGYASGPKVWAPWDWGLRARWLRAFLEPFRLAWRVLTSSTSAGTRLARGLLLLLPFLACFLTWLVAADPILRYWVTHLGELFRIENVLELGVRILLIAFWAWLWLAGVSRAHMSQSETEAPRGVTWPRLIGTTEALVVLVGLSGLLFAYLAWQARYLLAGDAVFQRYALTHASYARQGFAQLTVLAALSLAVVWFFDGFTRRETPTEHVRFPLAVRGLMALVVLVLASAMYRLSMYVQAYGWTRTRLLGGVFMVWLGVALLMVAFWAGRRASKPWAGMAVVLFWAFSATFIALNPDAFIARRNLARAQGWDDLDTGYLLALSADAWPVFARALDDDALAPAARQRLAAALACYIADQEDAHNPFRADGEDEPRLWMNLARWRAARAYEHLADSLLATYRVRERAFDQEVLVDGRWVDCDALLEPDGAVIEVHYDD